jgi:hypothetical protein
LTDGGGTLVRARSALRIQPGLGPDLDDAVARVKQAVTPGDEDAIECWAVWGIGAIRVTLHVRS